MYTYHFVTLYHPDLGMITVGRSNVTGEWYQSIEPKDSETEEQIEAANQLIEIAKIEGEPFIYHPRTNERLVRLNWILDGNEGSDSARRREAMTRFFNEVALPALQFN